MDDLTTMLSQVLSDPQAMQQIGAMAASLGLTDAPAPELPTTEQAMTAPQPQQDSSGLENLNLSALSGLLSSLGSNQPQTESPPALGDGGRDLSALSGLLGSLGNNQPQSPAPPPASNGLDLSALSSLLGSLGGTQSQAAAPVPAANGLDLSALSGLLGNLSGTQQSQQKSGGADISALTTLLGGGQQPVSCGGGGFPFDMNTLLKLQKAMSSITSNKANVDLLLALKPRLKDERAKKVDDAIRVMQLIQFLPLIKESGLFGDMENILGGLGGGGGGLGGIVNGLGSGIGGVLGNLFGGKK